MPSCVTSRHLILLAPRDHLGGLGSPVGRDRRDTLTRSQLSMITARAQRVWRVTFDALKDFSFHGASFISAVEPPTSRVSGPTTSDLAEAPSASRVRPGSAWSGWARWDRQRIVSGRCILVLHRLHIQSPRKWSTSADFRELAWTAVCESASHRYIHGQTDGSFIGQ